MYVYKISENAKMMSGYVQKDYGMIYLAHEKLYTQDEIHNMIMTCYKESNFYHKGRCECICHDMVEKFGFMRFIADVNYTYKSNGKGITKV